MQNGPDYSVWQARVDATLDRLLPKPQSESDTLASAMRYALFNGGKRIRPSLLYLSGQLFSVPLNQLDAAAAAIEIIHSYSLVHDDLPAMDDDDLRRGKPTCHKKFGEAIAILAGDALLNLAFETLSAEKEAPQEATQKIKLLSTLATASGYNGMVSGQAMDMASEGQQVNIATLEAIHKKKTGALIEASVVMGALCYANISDEELSCLRTYAQSIGLAFQIQDDILDVISDSETIGKPAGSDSEANKSTYPRLLGLDGARAKAVALESKAIDQLKPFGAKADPLRDIARYIVQRIA